MRVLLVDDHAMLRQGLALLLTQTAPQAQCLHASSLGEAETLGGAGDAVDLVLLDLDLPDSQGTEGLVRLRACLPETRIVILSAQEDMRTVEACIEAGACGFIHKSADFDRLGAALAQVVAGDLHLPPLVLAAAPRVPSATLDALSPRQLDVLRQLAVGASNKEIERRLGLSASTVKTHLAELFRRLDVTNRTQAVMTAAALGLRLKPKAG